jgi:hypothetical protein
LAQDKGVVPSQFFVAERICHILGEPAGASGIEADELRGLLTKYGVAFDERYLWD